MEEIRSILPFKMYEIINAEEKMDKLQEIRIKINKPIIVSVNNKEIILNYVPSIDDVKNILQKISNYSLYAFEEEIKQGFITIKGGHRIGLSGQWVIENGCVKTIKSVYSLNIRICREVIGCSNSLMKYIVDGERIYNTIIISPPKCGKTTLIRDISRNLSNGFPKLKISGKKVSIIDERSEIAASYNGIPQMDVGIRTDVFDNCLKSSGMMMAIRSMAPEVIICDEIGTNKDIEALLSAYNCGVNIITTIHGNNIEDLYKRIVFKELLDNKVIERVIVLSNRKGIGTVEDIINVISGRKEGECV
ncbi:stage III sporulation protein AA [Clostridium polyendosporum]|uniref:Stage III sporulation protein AA n=1 Tax=Clostridium polyendosporum TaxID=69208 RepID=A0A919RYT1_9CLOT|nr:stage III sporulation protein AA [Clostridium polyendosporum]GIM27955.1 stage III sporulation protein AA [Clostridium polyendosporum]